MRDQNPAHNVLRHVPFALTIHGLGIGICCRPAANQTGQSRTQMSHCWEVEGDKLQSESVRYPEQSGVGWIEGIGIRIGPDNTCPCELIERTLPRCFEGQMRGSCSMEGMQYAGAEIARFRRAMGFHQDDHTMSRQRRCDRTFRFDQITSSKWRISVARKCPC